MGTSDHTPGNRGPRVRRQEVVAELGERVLDTDDVDALVRDASAAVRNELEADTVAVLEAHPDGDRALVRHEVGRDDRTGSTVAAGPDTRTGRALAAGEPVVTETEISAVVGPSDDPWGVLCARTSEDRGFADHDAPFVRGVAAVLGTAVGGARAVGGDGSTADDRGRSGVARGGPPGVTDDGRSEASDGSTDDDAGDETTGSDADDADDGNADDAGDGGRRPLESERVYRALETASEGISLLDEDGEFVYVNDAYADLYGYDPEEMLGLHWEALYPEGETREIHEEALPQLDADGTWSGETTGLRKDGSQFVEDHYLASTGDGGMVCVVRDVTERKAMESQLEANNRTLQRLYAVSADQDLPFEEKVDDILALGRERLGVDVGFLAAIDEEADTFEVVRSSGDDERLEPGSVAPLSDTYCRRTIESDELLVVEDAPEEGWEDDHAYQQWEYDCYLGGAVHVDGERYGTLCFVSTSAHPSAFTASERTFVELVTQWVSYELERRRRERRLERYRAYTDDVLDAVDDVFYVLDESGTLQRWNETLPDVSGYAEAEVDSMHALEFFEPADHDPIATAIREGFESGQTQVRADVRTKSGETIPYEFVASALEDPAGDPVLAGIGRDVTERERNRRKLEETVAKLEASNERLEQFAYAASHDLQEPLRMVTSYLQLLEDRYSDDLGEDGEEFLDYAVDGADRMREMIEGLLTYSRIDTQGDPFEPVDLEEVVDEARADLQLRIAEADAEIDVGKLPTVVGDAGQLRQLFQNLLSNAIKYTEEGPPRIRVAAERCDGGRPTDRSTAAAEPSPRAGDGGPAATTEGPRWRISVSDDGIGMDPDETDRIFDVFDRLHSRADHDGTGIGLSICRRIVERHGGEIRVESEPGEGSTFHFTLPTTDGTHD